MSILVESNCVDKKWRCFFKKQKATTEVAREGRSSQKDCIQLLAFFRTSIDPLVFVVKPKNVSAVVNVSLFKNVIVYYGHLS